MATERLDRLIIRRPDDWHVHLRDGDMMKAVLPWTTSQFARAIIMPNLVPPVTTSAMAEDYRRRILAARPAGSEFRPLMTCYLTDSADADDIEKGAAAGIWVAAKLYPAGATTNAHHGVSEMTSIRPALERMERIGMPLLVHGEVTDPAVDIFDRETVFVEQALTRLLNQHPGLKIVLEHVTTAESADFVRAQGSRMGATITPHHLVINRTSMFQGGLRPHLYCLPVAKRERHRLALRKAATGGEPCFFLGTDTAPHPARAKESACGCAGCFVAPTALQVYAQVFDEEAALDRFEAFASLNGPRFYGLPANEGTLVLSRSSGETPAEIIADGERVVVFRGGENLTWSIEGGHVGAR